MSNEVKKEDSEFTLHRPTDQLDPGFALKGRKLYFVSAKKTENTPGRPWEIIRKKDLPVKLVEHIKKYNPRAFTEQEDTFRVGDLVLAMAPLKHLEPYKKARAEANREQMQSITAAPTDSHGNFKVEASEDGEDLTEEFFKK